MLALVKIGNVISSTTDSMPRYCGVLQMSRRIIFFQSTQQVGFDTGDYVTQFFALSDLTIEGVSPANQTALDAAFVELFRLDTDGSGGGGGGGDTVLSLNLTGTAAATTIVSATLSGKTILSLNREGIGFKQVIGTPGNRQFSFSGTTITFQDAFNTGGEEIELVYK